MSVKTRIVPALVAALLLAGCGDPQQAAQSKIQNVRAALANASKDLDPLDRLATYDKLLDQVKAVGANYGKTPTGRAIAAGDAVDGVSITGMQARRDALAARAKCYAEPTVECLLPFGSGASQGGTSQTRNALAQSAALVCAAGFPAADQSLASFKINQPVYAKQLVQLALAATACHKPDALKAAISAYLAAVPTDDGRIGSLLSILATLDLQPAWPLVFPELENGSRSGTIAGRDAGSVTLALALGYAQVGDIKNALAKYSYFIDTLHDHADGDSVRKLAAAVMVAGDADAALRIGATGDASTNGFFVTRAAANMLGARMGLTSDDGRPDNVINGLNSRTTNASTIQDYLKPTTGPAKAADEKSADAIEAQADKLAAMSAGRGTNVSGPWGLDSVYGILALARYEFGQPDKAALAWKKGQELRSRVAAQGDRLDNFTALSALVNLAQNDAAAAARIAKAGDLNDDHNKMILASAAAATGDAAKALSVRAEFGDGIREDIAYYALIAGLTRAGKPDEVDKLIAAYPGNPADKAALYEPMLDQMIADGNVDGARRFAAKHSPISGELGQYRFDRRLLESKKIAGDRGKAEPLIREMFKLGQHLDKGSGLAYEGGADHYSAQAAAAIAFQNGYTDLGIELYQAATNRDQRPQVAAFSDNMKAADMSKLLMLAQDNASGDALGYVIDQAIGYLGRKPAR